MLFVVPPGALLFIIRLTIPRNFIPWGTPINWRDYLGGRYKEITQSIKQCDNYLNHYLQPMAVGQSAISCGGERLIFSKHCW